MNSKFEKWDESGTLEFLQKVADACVHCGKCRESCAFLDKYEMDLGDVSKLQEHVYGCFLCGNCDRVCPVGISGRQELPKCHGGPGAVPGLQFSFHVPEDQPKNFGPVQGQGNRNGVRLLRKAHCGAGALSG